MRPQRPIGEEAKESLRVLLKRAKSKADFQRVQCVWLRAEFSMTSSQVALAIGWSPGTVRRVWSGYLAEGDERLIGRGRGGRRHQNLSVEEEEKLLARFLERSKAGGVLVVNEVKAAYEGKVGREVPKSTVYRMLSRHGWRKLTPRPRHPGADHRRQEEFKKNSET